MRNKSNTQNLIKSFFYMLKHNSILKSNLHAQIMGASLFLCMIFFVLRGLFFKDHVFTHHNKVGLWNANIDISLKQLELYNFSQIYV